MIKLKAYLLLENLDQLKKSKYGFFVCSVILDWYLFQLIRFLKPDSNWFNSFTLSWAEKVTSGTKSFVSIIVNVGSWFAARPATKKQCFVPVNLRLISQLIYSAYSTLCTHIVLYAMYPLPPNILQLLTFFGHGVAGTLCPRNV